jgi:hypothetical protein
MIFIISCHGIISVLNLKICALSIYLSISSVNPDPNSSGFTNHARAHDTQQNSQHEQPVFNIQGLLFFLPSGNNMTAAAASKQIMSALAGLPDGMFVIAFSSFPHFCCF